MHSYVKLNDTLFKWGYHFLCEEPLSLCWNPFQNAEIPPPSSNKTHHLNSVFDLWFGKGEPHVGWRKSVPTSSVKYIVLENNWELVKIKGSSNTGYVGTMLESS